MIRRHRGHGPDDEALVVAYAERLCAIAATIEPDPDFRSALRTTLLAESAATATVGVKATAVPDSRSRTRRRMAIVTGLVASCLGVGAMTNAAMSAVPGDTLYPVKRAVEAIQLAFRQDDESEGLFRLGLASERLDEASELTARDGDPAAREAGQTALREFSEQASLGSTEVLSSYRAHGDSAPVVRLNRFSASSLRQLHQFRPAAAHRRGNALDEARQQIESIIGSSSRTCPICTGARPLSLGRGPQPPSSSSTPGTLETPSTSPNPSSTGPAEAETPSATPSAAPSDDTKSDSDTSVSDSHSDEQATSDSSDGLDLPGTEIDDKLRDGLKDLGDQLPVPLPLLP